MKRSPIIVFTLALALLPLGCKRPQPSPVPASTPARPEPALHGHRGARGLQPENTLPAFERALDLEVDVLELDLHLSADGEIVVWHDPFIGAAKCRAGGPWAMPELPNEVPSSWSKERQLDGDVVDPDRVAALHPALAIANQRADQLRRLKCDRNPDAERFTSQQRTVDADYGVITLAELFAFVSAYAADEHRTESQREHARRVQFNVELKRAPSFPSFIADRFDGEHPAAFERALHEVLTAHDMTQRTIVQSFDHRSLWAFGALDGNARLAALQRKSEPTPDFAALQGRGAAIWSPDHRVLDAAAIERAHAAGLQVVPWTVNDSELAADLLDMGVDGLITDRPDIVRISATK